MKPLYVSLQAAENCFGERVCANAMGFHGFSALRLWKTLCLFLSYADNAQPDDNHLSNN